MRNCKTAPTTKAQKKSKLRVEKKLVLQSTEIGEKLALKTKVRWLHHETTTLMLDSPEEDPQCVGDEQCEADVKRKAFRILGAYDLTVLRCVGQDASANHRRRRQMAQQFAHRQLVFIIYDPIHLVWNLFLFFCLLTSSSTTYTHILSLALREAIMESLNKHCINLLDRPWLSSRGCCEEQAKISIDFSGEL